MPRLPNPLAPAFTAASSPARGPAVALFLRVRDLAKEIEEMLATASRRGSPSVAADLLFLNHGGSAPSPVSPFDEGSAYRCEKLSHCVAPAVVADQAKVMIARLGRDDIADLLPPEPRPDVDVEALHAEAGNWTPRGMT
jgi:hypothetical protein